MANHPAPLTLDAYVEGHLAPEARDRLESHLMRCGECRNRVAHNQQLGRWLRHLPPENAAPDLTFRIQAAVASRRRNSQLEWRGWSPLVLAACAGLGSVLLIFALPEISAAFINALTALETNPLSVSIESLISAPWEAFTSLVSTSLAWQTALTEGTGLILVLGLALLTVAALGGLAQLLREPAPQKGYFH